LFQWDAIKHQPFNLPFQWDSDGQQFHQYQQNKERLNSDSQQFHQYQQFFLKQGKIKQ
jgi:hypothetical protein